MDTLLQISGALPHMQKSQRVPISFDHNKACFSSDKKKKFRSLHTD